MRIHTWDAWGFQVGIESKGGQGRAGRRRTSCCAPADCCRVAAGTLLQRGLNKASSWAFPSQDVRMSTLSVKHGRSCWGGQRSQRLGGSRVWWQWGTAVIPAWNLIQVQIPSEEFLQKDSTVVAIHLGCLGLFLFKIQPVTQWKIGQPDRIDRGPFQTENISR